MNTVISRQEALAQGVKRYFTGKPCCRGHVAERLAHYGEHEPRAADFLRGAF
jgi:hypothetical protein